jgi:ketosteroid isomerase-like protein
MAVTEEELEQLIAMLDEQRARWISGQGEFAADSPMKQADDMTIFGPFGGPGPKPGSVTPEQLSAGQAAISAQFGGGEGSIDVVHTIVDGDLAVVVLIERSTVRFQALDGPQPWVLRTTQIFRKTDEGWLRLHRHADPLMHPRSLVDTVSLLQASQPRPR